MNNNKDQDELSLFYKTTGQQDKILQPFTQSVRGQIQGSDIPCMAIKRRDDESDNGASLTHLGGLSGAPALPTVDSYGGGGLYSSGIYGAQFKTIHKPTPYYDRNIPVTIVAPWLAQKQEATFMNRIKEKQEPPVKTYKDLKLSSIPDNMNEIYEPVIYKREAPMLEQF